MALDTYAGLRASIADWLIRDDLAAAIPSFVTLAEVRLNRDLRHWRMNSRDAITLDDRYVARPADWLATISLEITDAPLSRVRPASSVEMAQYRENSRDEPGRPCYYTHSGSDIELFPTPDASYGAVLTYRAKLPTLSDAQISNWLLQEAPDVYLYGSLLQAAPYLRDDARIPVWDGLYEAAVADLNAQAEVSLHGERGLRVRFR